MSDMVTASYSSETPFGESNALLAIIGGDEERALAILADMLPGERARLSQHARRLSDLADDAQRCPRCGLPDGTTWTGIFKGSSKRWHHDCLAAHDAEVGRRG